MNKLLQISLLIILLLIQAIGISYSQAEQYKFRHLTTKEGLSSNYVYSILKDSSGFMWFGTGNGLNRFDGNDIKDYKHLGNDSTSLSDNVVISMAELDSGHLLIGTASGGLNILDKSTEKFTRYGHVPGDQTSLSNISVNAILVDNERLIWIGTNDGLNLFYPESGKFDVFKQDSSKDENRQNQVLSLYKDSRGILWVGTNSGLFRFNISENQFLQVDLDPFSEFNNTIFQVNGINEDPFGIIWIGSNHGLYKYDNEINELIGPPYIHLGPVVEDIEFNTHDNMHYAWVSTRWGLYQYDFQTNKFTSYFSKPIDRESLSIQATSDLLYDENGSLWILSFSMGIDVLRLYESPFHQQFIKFDDQQDGFQFSASDFFEDADGNFWVGSHVAGLLKYDQNLNLISRKAFRFSDNTEFAGGRVKKILRDADGLLWVCVANPKPSICIYDEENEMFRLIDTTDMHLAWMFPVTYINDMIEDQWGNKWFGSYSGLGWIPGSESPKLQIQRIDHDELSMARIWDLYKDITGHVWVASEMELYSIYPRENDSLSFTKYSFSNEEDKLEPVNPRCVFQGSDGEIWVGTNQGLYHLKEGSEKFHPVSLDMNSKLLHENIISSITDDSKGNLWMATDKGLIRFNPGSKEGKGVKLFEKFDGLPYEGSVPGPLFKSRSGLIFVAGKYASQQGFYWFHPDSIRDNTHIPNIVITDFLVRNKPFSLDSNITFINHFKLKYNQNYFSFEYAALDYVNSEKNQYTYKLEGIDEDWVYADNRRFVGYTGIPSGEYIFHVKGSNNDGYWNETGTSILLTISPPPWRTWWAYSLYFLFIIGAIYAWRKYDLKRQHLKQQLELEKVEAAKLKELDSIKSRFFANISHEFRTPLTLILGPLEKLRSKMTDLESDLDLNIMQRNAHRLQNLINQLLSLSKIESGQMKLNAKEENIVALVESYVQSFESLANQKEINLLFKSEEEIIPLYIDKDKIEKILYNLLSNAFKFTPSGGRIAVSVDSRKSLVDSRETYDYKKMTNDYRLTTNDLLDNCAIISISDTGPGISPEALPYIFDRFYQADDSYTKGQEGSGIGLALTKELVELHHGKITSESQMGKGTKFSVYLPTGVEHLKPEEITDKAEPDDIQQTEMKLLHLSRSENQEMPFADDHEDATKPLLLIVEDNSDLRAYIRSFLSEEYNICEAIDGVKGLEKAIERIPDLVISDVMMPKMDGYQLCEMLKTDERTSHIPVILLTARASMESKIEGLERGADDFITKPFDAMELIVRVKNLIEQRRRWRRQFLKKFHRSDFYPFPQLLESSITSLDEKFLQKAYKIVEQRIDDPDLSVEQFVQEMAMSQVHLYRKLKALLGLSAIEFIRSIRMNHAARMIESQSDNLAQICFAVGFNSPSYFAECFKKQFGVTPSGYAKACNSHN